MGRAKKLPSGSWRIQVFDHSEKIHQPDGTIKEKKIRRSFTVNDPSPAGRKECERQAAMWAAGHSEVTQNPAESVRDAIERYCDEKRAVLSPSTIKGYKSILRSRIGSLGDVRLTDLTDRTIQRWVNGLVDDGLAPKTVKNIYGLLSAVIYAYLPDRHFRITLPQQVRPDLYVPSDSDIQALIEYFSANDKDMLYAVYLAAFGSLRRSEVCALTAGDIDGNIVHVRHAVVETDGNKVVQKTTKTYSSQRDVIMPDYIIEQLPTSGRIVNLTPQMVTHRFTRTLKRLGLPSFRFHDLRHYTASIMHALGIPDAYIMERGGWSSDGTLKRIYRNSMDEYAQKFNGILMDHFEEMDISSHESSHGKKKAT